MTDSVVIAGAARTPMGGLQGVLAPVAAPALGAAAVKAALERAKVPGDAVDESIMGCVLPAGMGQAPARQASLGAGIPVAAGCTTVNKMCGSGMKAVMFAHDAIKAGSAEIVVAGGMESMTNSPYLLPKVRDGMRLGHGEVLDHMFYDGLEDAYEKGRLMGTFAEDCATKYGFSREAQDAYAIESLTRARNAVENGEFAREITAVEVHARRETKVIDVDEQPGKANLERIPELRPAFAKNGTVTAANSSSISDGAAALVVISAEKAAALDLLPRARIVAHASFAQEPGWFTTAPVTAVQMLLDRIGWTVDQVDLFEVNEAFAVVAMAAMHGLEIPHAKLNVRGGACALGHPIGASGARILVTLLHALEDLGLKRGVASLCIGGGEATAVALEIGV
ncbi:MAG TPA: acetyl-CoA C-acyltransferase [Gammaproteobacteria bacterium]|nr:acetyl-CoA C-acyltransferase [Gammaproteobacteria bacterium]